MTLPPLPNAAIPPTGIYTNQGLYTEEQMREYGQQCREAALEEAAQSLLEAGFRSTGIPAYESLAERVRKLK